MNLNVLAILNHPHSHLWYLLSLLSSSLLSISASRLPSLLYPSASKSDISFTLILLCSLSLYFHHPFHRSLSTKRILLHSINLYGISPPGFRVLCVSVPREQGPVFSPPLGCFPSPWVGWEGNSKEWTLRGAGRLRSNRRGRPLGDQTTN